MALNRVNTVVSVWHDSRIGRYNNFINYMLSLASLSFIHLQHVYIFQDFQTECQAIKLYTLVQWNPNLLNLLRIN